MIVFASSTAYIRIRMCVSIFSVYMCHPLSHTL